MQTKPGGTPLARRVRGDSARYLEAHISNIVSSVKTVEYLAYLLNSLHPPSTAQKQGETMKPAKGL